MDRWKKVVVQEVEEIMKILSSSYCKKRKLDNRFGDVVQRRSNFIDTLFVYLLYPYYVLVCIQFKLDGSGRIVRRRDWEVELEEKTSAEPLIGRADTILGK